MGEDEVEFRVPKSLWEAFIDQNGDIDVRGEAEWRPGVKSYVVRASVADVDAFMSFVEEAADAVGEEVEDFGGRSAVQAAKKSLDRLSRETTVGQVADAKVLPLENKPILNELVKSGNHKGIHDRLSNASIDVIDRIGEIMDRAGETYPPRIGDEDRRWLRSLSLPPWPKGSYDELVAYVEDNAIKNKPGAWAARIRQGQQLDEVFKAPMQRAQANAAARSPIPPAPAPAVNALGFDESMFDDLSSERAVDEAFLRAQEQQLFGDPDPAPAKPKPAKKAKGAKKAPAPAPAPTPAPALAMIPHYEQVNSAWWWVDDFLQHERDVNAAVAAGKMSPEYAAKHLDEVFGRMSHDVRKELSYQGMAASVFKRTEAPAPAPAVNALGFDESMFGDATPTPTAAPTPTSAPRMPNNNPVFFANPGEGRFTENLSEYSELLDENDRVVAEQQGLKVVRQKNGDVDIREVRGRGAPPPDLGSLGPLPERPSERRARERRMAQLVAEDEARRQARAAIGQQLAPMNPTVPTARSNELARQLSYAADEALVMELVRDPFYKVPVQLSEQHFMEIQREAQRRRAQIAQTGTWTSIGFGDRTLGSDTFARQPPPAGMRPGPSRFVPSGMNMLGESGGSGFRPSAIDDIISGIDDDQAILGRQGRPGPGSPGGPGGTVPPGGPTGSPFTSSNPYLPTLSPQYQQARASAIPIGQLNHRVVTTAPPVTAPSAIQNAAANAASQVTSPPPGPPAGPTPTGGVGSGGGSVPPVPPTGSGAPFANNPGGRPWLWKAGGAKNIGKTALSRAMGPVGFAALGTSVGSNLLRNVWDDPESQYDDAAAGALGAAGIGATIGSVILPGWGTAIGAGLGGLYGGVKGWIDGDKTSSDAIRSASQEQMARLNESFDRLGIDTESRRDLFDQLDTQLAFARSTDEVDAIFAQAAQLAPTMIGDMRRRARMAALQAAILPMMEQNAQRAQQASQRSQGWLNQAASIQSNPEVAALLRSQGEQLMAQQASRSQAAYGYSAALPLLNDLGISNLGPQMTDYNALLAQLQPAG